MLTEEYRCLTCAHVFPSRLPIKEEKCPRCGGTKLERNPWLMGTHSSEDLSAEDYRYKVEVTT